jgi:hypothetical protein
MSQIKRRGILYNIGPGMRMKWEPGRIRRAWAWIVSWVR